MHEFSKEAVCRVPVNSLKNFKDFPFRILEDESMAELVSSVKEFGVITPLTVIPADDGSFEIISGHRRKRACQLAGISEVPVIIKHLSRDKAIILMVDSNLQRESLLPSEKARAYKMRNDAIKRSVGRPSVDEQGESEPGKTIDRMAENAGESATKIQRYIRFNNLVPELLDYVDTRKMGEMVAYHLSFLTPEEQNSVAVTIDSEQAFPSVSQAQRMKKSSKDKKLNEDLILQIMSERKKPESFNVIIPIDKLKKYFPKAVSPKEIEEKLLALCERLYQQQQAKKRANER